MLKYLAYGSNLHPVRLQERTPSARLLGVVALQGWALLFHKRGTDLSAKCDLVKDPVAGQVAYGAVYELPEAERAALDAVEGLGSGYEECRLRLPDHGEVFFYVASPAHIAAGLLPYDWYRNLVLTGARYHRFPPEYIDQIARTEAMPDPDPVRRAAQEALMERCRRF